MFSVDSPLPESSKDGAAVTAAALMRIVLYFDVFRHPLRIAELQWMTGAGTAGMLEPALRTATAQGWIEAEGGFVFRSGRSSTVARRQERTQHAERMWPAAMAASRILARLPFVRGVMLTGGLSKQSAEPGGDADFLLLVEPGCVWTTKSALQIVRRVLPDDLRRFFCTNYLLSVDDLPLDDRDVFTAFELATAIPLSGTACSDFLRANRWVDRWVTGYDWAIRRADAAPPGSSAPSRLGPLARTLDAPLRDRWSQLWDQKYDWLDDNVRARRFKRSPTRATNHLHDFREFVVREYRERCADIGVDPLQDPLHATSQQAAERTPAAARPSR